MARQALWPAGFHCSVAQFGHDGTAATAARGLASDIPHGAVGALVAVLGTGSVVRRLSGQPGGAMVIELRVGSSAGLRQVEEAGVAGDIDAVDHSIVLLRNGVRPGTDGGAPRLICIGFYAEFIALGNTIVISILRMRRFVSMW